MKKILVLLFLINIQCLFAVPKINIEFEREVSLVDEVADNEYLPISAVLDKFGNLWVVDLFANKCLVKFKKDGEKFKFIKEVTKVGQGPGEINIPSNVNTDSNGNIYVGERGNRRIHVFDNSGKFLYSFVINSDMTYLKIKIDFLYVSINTEAGRNGLIKYDLKGNVLEKLIKIPKLRNKLEEAWAFPIFDISKNSEMFVAFSSPELNLRKYDKTGKYTEFGNKSMGDFKKPKIVFFQGDKRVMSLTAFLDLQLLNNKYLLVLERGGFKNLIEEKKWKNNTVAVYSLNGDFLGRFNLKQEISNSSKLLPIANTNSFYYYNLREPLLYKYKLK